jgi:hypothetical protein
MNHKPIIIFYIFSSPFPQLIIIIDIFQNQSLLSIQIIDYFFKHKIQV